MQRSSFLLFFGQKWRLFTQEKRLNETEMCAPVSGLVGDVSFYFLFMFFCFFLLFSGRLSKLTTIFIILVVYLETCLMTSDVCVCMCVLMCLDMYAISWVSVCVREWVRFINVMQKKLLQWLSFLTFHLILTKIFSLYLIFTPALCALSITFSLSLSLNYTLFAGQYFCSSLCSMNQWCFWNIFF